MAVQDTGSWGELKDWPLIGLHAIVTQDGKVMTFGTDSQGMQSGAFIYDLWDPVTDTHTTLDNETATDIFCSAAIILPGTSKIIIGGGDGRPQGNVNTGVDDVNFFDNDDYTLTQSTLGEMNFERWYPTMVSLPSGQAVILGGRGGRDDPGVGTPEIFTDGEGWRKLDGATDSDLVPSNSYPRAFVNGDGNITYFASGKGTTGQTEVRVLDPSGEGSLETIATLPFNHAWATPAIMYEAGKVLISATNGDMWTMDITGSTPVFEQTDSLENVRNWSDLTVMADGKVLVNGGTTTNNTEAGSDKTAAIWDPETGEWDYTVDEAQPRLYHSGSVLLADGTILSLGGGAAGSQTNYLDAQIYQPPYLYGDDGELADRPVITGAPDELNPGDTFTIQSDSTISKMTLVKNGAATHSFNMEARMINLDFTQNADGSIDVQLPENANEVTAGSWMLFAFDEDGVPAQAPIVAIQPTLANFDGIGDVTAEYFAIDTDANSLDQIDFDDTVIHVERVLEVNENSAGAFFSRGPADDFAIKYSGDFFVSQPGDYTFYLTSDDGSRLSIDGEQVIDNDGVFAATQKTVTLNLEAGNHAMELRYFENGGPGSVDLDWSGPGFVRTQMRFDGAEDNLLVNGGIEKANLSAGAVTDTTDLAGWTTTNNVELWSGGFGQAADSGYTLTEIDAQNGTLSQAVSTEAGEMYDLSFALAGRQGQLASSGTEVLWNGAVLATIEPTSATFENYQFEVEGTGGEDVLAFRAKAGDTDAFGGLLDSVVLRVAADSVDPEPTGTRVLDIPNETQFLDGVADNDTFVIAGQSSDYGWGATEDGTGTVVWGPTGHDILTGFEAIEFTDQSISLGQTGDQFQDIAGVTQFVTGTDATEAFVIEGQSADYNWGKTQDGTGFVVWGPTGNDLLFNVEEIQFADTTVTLDPGTPGSGVVVNDIVSETQYEFGTNETDRFVIDGNSGDYLWAATGEPNGYVVWDAETLVHDILYDFEEIEFNDQIVDL